MDWKLTPYKSLGPIQFGMSKEQVSEPIGPAKRRRIVSSILVEIRDIKLPHVHYKNDSVIEVEAYPEAGYILIGNINFFLDDIDELKSRLFSHGEIYEGAGVIVSLNIGISTNIFHSSSARSAAAFAEGYWDRNIPNLRKIT